MFLVVIVQVSHPYTSVDHTYAFIIIFLVITLMCRAVIDTLDAMSDTWDAMSITIGI